MGIKALTLHMDEEIIDDFRNYCKLNALKLSAKVELLLKREMDQAHNNPTLVKMFQEMVKKQHHKEAGKSKEQSTIEETKEEPRYESYPENIEKPDYRH